VERKSKKDDNKKNCYFVPLRQHPDPSTAQNRKETDGLTRAWGTGRES
jgi:hypothetical protein